MRQYATWYNARGIDAIGFVIPFTDIFSVRLGEKAELHVDDLVTELERWLLEGANRGGTHGAIHGGMGANHGGRRTLLFHTFSNTGWIAYGAALLRLQRKYGKAAVDGIIKGCIVDSAPILEEDPKVWASGFSAAILQKRSAATRMGSLVIDSVVAGGIVQACGRAVGACGRVAVAVVRVVKVRLDALESVLVTALWLIFQVALRIPYVKGKLGEITNTLHHHQPNCPQLYFYSEADIVIPLPAVENFILGQRAQGHRVMSMRFECSPHVDHFRTFPELYTQQLETYLKACLPHRFCQQQNGCQDGFGYEHRAVAAVHNACALSLLIHADQFYPPSRSHYPASYFPVRLGLGNSEPEAFTVSASLPESEIVNGPPIVHMPVRKPESLSVGFAVPEEEKQGAAMWQVYVLGAYLIGTWLWAKSKKASKEDEIAKLTKQLTELTDSMFAEGILDDQFTQLQQLQDESNPEFVGEVIGLFFEDSVKLLDDLTQEVNEDPIDFKKVDAHVHQFKGSSSSIGAQRVKALCIKMRGYCDEGNRAKCLSSLDKIKDEFNLVKDKLELMMSSLPAPFSASLSAWADFVPSSHCHPIMGRPSVLSCHAYSVLTLLFDSARSLSHTTNSLNSASTWYSSLPIPPSLPDQLSPFCFTLCLPCSFMPFQLERKILAKGGKLPSMEY
ncbi:unnamed protein product [Closterium sp. Yama58-4]|nr:unnamed protein product [Closterium sp. Yama58-4]